MKSHKAPGNRDLTEISGTFSPIANGVFLIQLRNETFAATQFWAFKPDRSAEIKELPDRGEMQKAVPVADKE
jgi:hypothetical protein